MIIPRALSVAPTEPNQREQYIQELKAQYQRGELRPQMTPTDLMEIDDRLVRVVLPHLYPPVVAEA